MDARLYIMITYSPIGSEKFYHTPESPWYEQTKPKIMFCTEGDAVKAP
jgi:micrococcal nuclease